MLGSTNFSTSANGLAAERRSRTVEAFLAQRVPAEKLAAVMETESEQWEDTFTSLTARNQQPKVGEPEAQSLETIEELGLFRRLEELKDDQVWSAQDRALHRVVSHLSSPRFTGEDLSIKSATQPFFQTALAQFGELDRNGDTFLDSA